MVDVEAESGISGMTGAHACVCAHMYTYVYLKKSQLKKHVALGERAEILQGNTC